MKVLAGFTLPSTMKALILEDYNTILKLQEKKVPIPRRGEILVKIEYSPVNPSDVAFLQGNYPTKKSLPITPGFEGSGKVVATGDDFLSRRLLGKYVACLAPVDNNGTWAEYMLTGFKQAIPLKKTMNTAQGSMLFVNPLSVIAMIDIAKTGKHIAIANTAAASALGQMLNKMCLAKNIELVNIVRRKEQEELLREQGAKHFVISSSYDFKTELSAIFSQLNVTLAYDAVSGQSVFDLLEALPEGGEVMVYGALDENPINAHPGDIIFRRKKVSGFYLLDWMNSRTLLKQLSIIGQVQKFLASQHQITVRDHISLEEATDGIKTYLEVMTAGKVLIAPGKS